MDWKNITKSISAFAPALGAAIGGPIGSVAGMGVKVLCDAFGVDVTSDDAIAQVQIALGQMTPEQAMLLKNADKQFKVEMKKLDIDVFKLEMQDKANARDMFKVTRNWTPAILTFMFVGIAAYLVYNVFNSQMTGLDKTLVGTVIGYVFGEVKQCTSFWVGSSKGSQDKTVAMSDLSR
jgi:hypothetical protein